MAKEHVNKMKINSLPLDHWLKAVLTHLNSETNVLSKLIHHTSNVLIAVRVSVRPVLDIIPQQEK